MAFDYLKSQCHKYFEMIVDGCGNSECRNENCASSGLSEKLTNDQAALKAIDLLKVKATLCITTDKDAASLVERKLNSYSEANSSNGNSTSCTVNEAQSSEACGVQCSRKEDKAIPKESCKAHETEYKLLNEECVEEIVRKCTTANDFSLLRRTFGSVFSNKDQLNSSFLIHDTSSIVDDSKPSSSLINVDLASAKRTFKRLMDVPDLPFLPALTNALTYLFDNVEVELHYNRDDQERGSKNYLNMFVITAEVLLILNDAPGSSEAFEKFCKAVSRLSVASQGQLAKYWSKLEASQLLDLIRYVQQFLTMRILTNTFTRTSPLQSDRPIISVVCFLRVLFYAAVYGACRKEIDIECTSTEQIGGSLDLNTSNLSSGDEGAASMEDESENHHIMAHYWKTIKESKFLSGPSASRADALSKHLGVCCLDFSRPTVPLDEFYNETISEAVAMDVDFSHFIKINEKGDDIASLIQNGTFSFMLFPFILVPSVKMIGLVCFNRINMQNESRRALTDTLLSGIVTSPYLHLKIRRNSILHDALANLEIIAAEEPDELKKQLFIELEHEQAVDEGGVSKEFYQLITAQLFNLDYGMFVFNETTRLFWFNSFCTDCTSEYTLIGMLFGLAIYNNIIVDVQFPSVLYKKLMNKNGSFGDLEDFDPVLYSSLKSMLDHEDDDFDAVFGYCSFKIGLKDTFGSEIACDLVENGDQKSVTKENRKEFVKLYADYLLNKSVEQQYRAFEKGFMMVVNESPLFWLFRPDELDQIVCGSKDLDFSKLETCAEYDNGYSAEHRTIKNFWEVFREMSKEQKCNLLQFVTGSDRVPVGGMSKLRFLIVKNGSDTDQLPTAQTCFNVLLLPNYSTKEKLRDRLYKAITHCKGFGIL